MNPGEGRLQVAWQLPEVKDYNGDMQRPPDFGRNELHVTQDTRVWKEDQPMKLAELKIGDALLINLTSGQTSAPARCTDLWIGEDTHKLVSEARQKKQKSAKPIQPNAVKQSRLEPPQLRFFGPERPKKSAQGASPGFASTHISK